jgi:hypothetical protein
MQIEPLSYCPKLKHARVDADSCVFYSHEEKINIHR